MSIISLFKDGRFRQTVSGPRQYVIEPTISAWDGDWVEGKFDDSWWIYGGIVRQRKACPVFVDGLTLRGVRPGSMIMIEGCQYECAEGGDVELSFQYPGVYEVTVSRWPYLDGRYIVENSPPAEQSH